MLALVGCLICVVPRLSMLNSTFLLQLPCLVVPTTCEKLETPHVEERFDGRHSNPKTEEELFSYDIVESLAIVKPRG